jgi:precorrin-6Y C5,15-methyltransferase (decarboxylating)
MDPRWLAILGIGAGGVDGLSAPARALIAEAELVVGGARHLELAAPLIRGRRMPWPSPLTNALPAILDHRGASVVILASGDPFWYGIGNTLMRQVPASETICLPAPSSLSLACARLGWAMQDVEVVSACGRPLAPLIPLLQPRAHVLVLSADADTPGQIAELLRARNFGAATLHVMEELGGARERIRTVTAESFDLSDIRTLNLVALDILGAARGDAKVIPMTCGLADDLFSHDGQITKREIRAITLSSLAPRRGELLWDIGAGSGSVGIEWMLRHVCNRAIAIESNSTRAARAGENAAALGVPGLRVVVGRAPACLEGLPTPDAIFVGGGARDDMLIAAAWAALRPDGRIVANAVTIDSEAALVAASAKYGGHLTRISVERMDQVGRMRAYRPAMTVTQWAATKP